MTEQEEMTSRERLLTVLDGGIPDRVPVNAWIDHLFAAEYLGRDEVDLVDDVIDVQKAFGLDVILRTAYVEMTEWGGDRWEAHTAEDQRDGRRFLTTVFETPDGTLRHSWLMETDAPGYEFMMPVELPVKTKEDLDILKKYGVTRPPVDISWPKRAVETIGSDGMVIMWAGGAAYNIAALFIRGQEQLFYDAHDDPGFYSALLEYATFYDMPLARQLAPLCRDGDMLFVGANVATGQVVGPRFYRQHILPYDREYIRQMQELGVKVLYHNCGYSAVLLEAYRELGVDGIESFPPPPTGDSDLKRVKQVLGDVTVLFGNVDQVHLMKEGTPDEVAEATLAALRAGKPGGRFVLQTSDMLYDETPIENVRAFADTGTRHGWYRLRGGEGTL